MTKRGLELPINLLIILVVAFFIFTLIIGFVPRLLGGSLGKLGRISSYVTANSLQGAISTCQTWAESASTSSSSPQQFLTSTYCTKRVGVPVKSGCWPSSVNAGSDGEWYHNCGGGGVSLGQCGAEITNWNKDALEGSCKSRYACDPGFVSSDNDYSSEKKDGDLCFYVPTGVKYSAALPCWDPMIGIKLDGVLINSGEVTFNCGVKTFYVHISKDGKYILLATPNAYGIQITDTGQATATIQELTNCNGKGCDSVNGCDFDNNKKTDDLEKEICDLNNDGSIPTNAPTGEQFSFTEVSMCACKDETDSVEGEYSIYEIYYRGKIWKCYIIEKPSSSYGYGKCLTSW